MTPKSQEARVESLAGECQGLARALKLHADSYSFPRTGDAKFLTAMAEQLDRIAEGLIACMAGGDGPGVRRASWWAKGIAGLIVGAAAVTSGVKDGQDLLGADQAVEVFGTDIVNIAKRTHKDARFVHRLPADQLVTSPRPK